MEQIENNLSSVLDNTSVNFILRILVAVYAAFAVPFLPTPVLQLANNTVVKVILGILIIYITSIDIPMGLLLALAFILTLLQADKSSLNSKIVSEYSNTASEDMEIEELQQENQVDQFSGSDNNDLDEDEIKTMNLSVPSENLKTPVVELLELDVNNNSSPFTSEYQFLDAQNNEVPGAKQDSVYTTFDNQHSTQGLEKLDTNPISDES